MRANLPETNRKRIVIVGAGFAGLTLAKKLLNSNYEVVLLDRNNYHTFIPLLYQVATAGLEPESISYPIRKIFKRKKHFHFRMAELISVHPDDSYVMTDIGRINYDHLVLAHGSETNFFGNKELEKHSFNLKSSEQAMELRSYILSQFEKAITLDESEREPYLNFVIVGAGPTGVELSGALSELKNHILPSDFPELDFSKMKVYLVEGMDRVLPAMSEASSKNAEKYLKGFGVEVMLNTMVSDFDGKVAHYKMKDESSGNIQTKSLVWAAGVKGSFTEGLHHEAFGKGQRIMTDEYSKVKGTENIYAIGDLAMMQTEEFPEGHPQLAPVAMQQAEQLAENFKRKEKDKEPLKFRYNDKGSMATVGRNKAVVDLPNAHLKGYPAWLAWMLLHLFQLIGFRNKVSVLVDWLWNYLTYDRGVRLIFRK